MRRVIAIISVISTWVALAGVMWLWWSTSFAVISTLAVMVLYLNQDIIVQLSFARLHNERGNSPFADYAQEDR